MFGKIFEHSPWVAERAWDNGLGEEEDSVEALHSLLSGVVGVAKRQEQMQLVANHPQLAVPVPAGEANEASRDEQARAGLDSLDEAGRDRFAELNAAYLAKFGFPFILAVEGLQSDDILERFERRVSSDDRGEELQAALDEVIKIARLRLERM